jgi:heat shock protein HslJ
MRPAVLIALLATGLTGCATRENTAAMSTDRTFDLASYTGTTWVAEDINAQGVIDNLQSSLHIVSADQVDGFAGCNSFSGKADLSAGKVRLGPLASTRKMCPPAIMNQEGKFLMALDKSRSARIENGLLYLLDESGQTILRFWERK